MPPSWLLDPKFERPSLAFLEFNNLQMGFVGLHTYQLNLLGGNDHDNRDMIFMVSHSTGDACAGPYCSLDYFVVRM